jgi:nucleotide-binding universal stress UspA family protein
MVSRIVLAIDDDMLGEPVKMAGDLAGLTGATVLVVHCDELDTFFDTGVWLNDDTEPRTAIGTAVRRLRDRGVKARGVTVRTNGQADTARAIAGQGQDPEADILVLGLPRLHHLGGLFVGSVAAGVAARTTTPLLLVPCR